MPRAAELQQHIQIADYQFKPPELDPDQVLLCLPEWTIENQQDHPRWIFKEPNDNLWVEINSRVDHGRDTATITRFMYDGDRVTSSYRIATLADLRLIVVQIRPTTYCLGLYGADGTCYLTRDRSSLVDYRVSFWTGRDITKVPFWTDRLPFRKLSPFRSYFETRIP